MMVNTKIEDCCRSPYKIVTIEYYDNNIKRLFYQCLHCGGAFKTKPLSHKQFMSQIRSEFNHNKFTFWREERLQEYSLLRESIERNNYETSKYAEYVRYLKSTKWRRIRKDVLERDENMCQECKVSKAEHVHHLTYDNLFNETLEDLLSVCSKCHTKIHKELDMREFGKFD
ncbi:hypothetical protein [Tenacibaculum sp. 190130A14a]